MDPELIAKIDNLEIKIDESTRQISQLRRYFLWALIISVAVLVLPLLGLVFVVPQFLDLYSGVMF